MCSANPTVCSARRGEFTVVVEYPSLEKATAAYDSPAYVEALKALVMAPCAIFGSLKGWNKSDHFDRIEMQSPPLVGRFSVALVGANPKWGHVQRQNRLIDHSITRPSWAALITASVRVSTSSFSRMEAT